MKIIIMANKKELIAKVAEVTGVTKKDVETIVNTLVGTIKETLVSGEEVVLSGLGKFTVVEVAGREGISKLKGEEKAWKTEDHKAPKFKFAKEIKDAVK